ncbi:MAG: alkaline phosphatase family protein [Balneolaceae bacterium]|nr:alkaline phosphatase family protein [Balneolaceae bacterium]
MAVLFLFVDGIGLGEPGAENPFHRFRYPAFSRMAGEQPFTGKAYHHSDSRHLFKGIDATLGVEGLPQSGTGQATLFTGQNAARIVGRHFGPYPHSKIKPILKNRSLFHRAASGGKQCRFMNAYPDIFFRRSQERNRWSCTTLMTRSAGIELYTERDLKRGRAITAEITQEAWRERLGIDVPTIEPREASKRMLNAARHYDLLLYEFYLTDKAGHAQSSDQANEILGRYDAFLGYLLDNLDENDTLVLSSDHGNLEDLSTKTHTFNRVPLFVQGPAAGAFRDVDSIQGITPAILHIL